MGVQRYTRWRRVTWLWLARYSVLIGGILPADWRVTWPWSVSYSKLIGLQLCVRVSLERELSN